LKDFMMLARVAAATLLAAATYAQGTSVHLSSGHA
jgi:hypothetical protein